MREQWYSSKSFVDTWCFIENSSELNGKSSTYKRHHRPGQVSVFFTIQFPNDRLLRNEFFALYESWAEIQKGPTRKKPFFDGLTFVSLNEVNQMFQISNVSDIVPTTVGLIPIAVILKEFKIYRSRSNSSNIKVQFGMRKAIKEDNLSVATKAYLTKVDINEDIPEECKAVDTLILIPLQPYNRILK